MSDIGFGPLARIDGPRPVPPRFGLLQAADAPAAGVTIVTDTDAGGRERWGNGVEVFPYPPEPPVAWNACAPGTYRDAKDSGPDVTNPQFDPITLYLAVKCKGNKIPFDDDAYRQRARDAFAAKESAGLAREFMRGDELTLNPNLGNSDALDILNGGAVTSPTNALALLEWAIAQTGSAGIIHMTPEMVVSLGALKWDTDTGVLRTPAGTVVVPDAGYAHQSGFAPAGGTPAHGTQEWVFATGPVDIRRSEMFVTPDTAREALDRETNELVFRVERYYLVDWDVQLHAAVKADRCQTGC